MSLFHFSGQTGFYQGKVRDVYYIGDDLLVMLASDRISAFDVILPRPIPYKGQVLNQMAAFMLESTRDICPNWLLSSPAPNVSIGKKCTPFRIELVVRGTLTGHAWRTYASGIKELCGAIMPEGMREHDFFPSPIITPSTKAMEGHDEDIRPEQILEQGLATESEWSQLCNYALGLFARGQKMANQRGLILADTKYEFGICEGAITLMDEVHTPDSSRYFLLEGFDERQAKGMPQKQLSKEFVREWLISHDFMGKEGQKVPSMTNEWVGEISARYIELYEKMVGQVFEPKQMEEDETIAAVEAALAKIRR
jgi:phosphoribosylaminoimidazole-succinocarboxamide synthase